MHWFDQQAAGREPGSGSSGLGPGRVGGHCGRCVAVLQGEARHGQNPREAEEGAGGGAAAEQ